MSISTQLLDAVKASNGGLSDYKLAQILGVKQPTMSQYRNNKCPLSADKVILCCKLAGLDVDKWLLSLYIERAKTDDEAAALNDMLHRLAA